MSKQTKRQISGKEIIQEIRLEDKIALCSGQDFWHTKAMPQYGIPAIMVADGPHGLRKQVDSADMLGVNESVPATCFPTAVTSACSWDETLLQEVGQAIGAEAADNQVSVVLGPGANIKRNPLCGRNFEYFSEDPHLTGKLAAAWIKGVEGTGVGASLKHFALNNQEYKRFSSDSQVDERTMREIYLAGFETAVKEGKPATVMCAYNKINGEYCSDNKTLLTDILRKEWGFDGLVVTDWGSMSDRIKGFRAGCDLVMPGGSSYMEKECRQAVKEGRLSEKTVDRSVKRVLQLVQQGQAAMKKGREDITASEASMQAHYELARKAAAESAVLLKNEDHILPLQSEAGLVFIGHMAKEIRYQGAGSSHINPWKLTSVTDRCPGVKFVEGCDALGNTTKQLLQQARDAAAKAEKAVLFVGLPDSYESEGFDREHMEMPAGHLKLIKAVTEVNPNTIVVLLCGSVVEVPWLSKVKALLYLGLPGEAGGDAIADLLFGKVNPSGRLAETWPKKYEDCVCSGYYAGHRKDAQYREGLYVGYRYYESAGVRVRFPFGYGLSYSSFAYSDLKIEGNQVSCRVTNVGAVPGKEVVQLYIEPEICSGKLKKEDETVEPKFSGENFGDANSGKDAAVKHSQVYRPKRELKAFSKVELQPGESRTVSFLLNERSFAVWNQGWKVPEGSYRICIGKDAHHMVLTQTVEDVKEILKTEVPGTEKIRDTFGEKEAEQNGIKQIPVQKISAEKVPDWYWNPIGRPAQEDFEALLGRKVYQKPLRKGEFTKENSVLEMRDYSLVMKLLYKILEKMMAKGFGGKADYNNPTFRMMVTMATDSSISGIKINGAMNNYLLEGMLEMANGHYLRGVRVCLQKNS